MEESNPTTGVSVFAQDSMGSNDRDTVPKPDSADSHIETHLSSARSTEPTPPDIIVMGVKKPDSSKEYHCLPAEWNRTCWCISQLCFPGFFFVRLYATFCRKFGNINRPPKREKTFRLLGERTKVTRTSSLSRQNSADVLEVWLARMKRAPNISYTYSSFYDLAWTVTYCSAGSAYAKHCARQVLADKEQRETNTKIVHTLAKIRQCASRSIKFRFLYNSLKSFLDDIEKSMADSMEVFMKNIANNFLSREDSWYVTYVHNYLRKDTVSKNVYETTVGIVSLFSSHGAGLEHFLFFGGWYSQGTTGHDAGITLIKYCAIEACRSLIETEINVTEFTGLERILLDPDRKPFKRYVSRGMA